METTEKHYLSFSAKDIDIRLEKVDNIPTRVSQLINDKGYVTANDIPEVEIPDNIATIEDIAKKQDKIEDLDTIRSGAAKGATAIQEVKTINGQSIVGSGNIIIEGDVGDVDLSGYVTKVDADRIYQPKGNYALEDDIPEVPTKVSELENDSKYITLSEVPRVDLTDYAKKEDLPIVPKEISSFNNDVGYITQEDVVPYDDSEIKQELRKKVGARVVATTTPTEGFPTVMYIPQNLTEEQKTIARANIGIEEYVSGVIGQTIINELNMEV